MILNILNRFLGFVLAKLALLLGIFKNREIWIIGASGGKKYTNNGAALYRYVLENHPEIDIYWIINKDAPDIHKARKEGPFLYRNTVKGNFYALMADVLICTHALGDISKYAKKRHKNSFKVFISHGIEAFKIKYPKHVKEHFDYNLSLAVSEFEKNIKVEKWGLDEDKVCITGLPRYDILEAHKKGERENIKRIFYMPHPVEGRPFKKDPMKLTKEEIEEFKRKHYYQALRKFLSSPKLIELLKVREVALDVFFHQSVNPLMGKIMEIPGPSNISFVSNRDDIQEKILQSDMLIADHSSVAWDFLYMDRPVIFFRFYEKEFESYLRTPQDLFGPLTKNEEETVEEVRRVLEGNDNYKEKREESRKEFIKYHDGRNCERVVNCILEKKSKIK